MLRSASSLLARRATAKKFSRGLPAAFNQRLNFHSTGKREDAVAPKEQEEKTSSWEPIYYVPLGIAFAVPAIQYEWYPVNEETQLAACFVAFCAVVYKQFGGSIYEILEQDGKRIMEEQNRLEDQVLDILKTKKEDIVMQANVVQDAQDIHALKVLTYEKLNAAGKIKPQHEFKAQVERILTAMQAEETAMIEKAKIELMVEATASVTEKLLTTKKLQKACLDNAILQLQGTKVTSDPVKEAYLDFFRAKAASKVDEKAEISAARQAMITKLSAMAANESFFFTFENGTPKMTV